MFKIIFPEFKNQRYWNLHFEYVLNIFKRLECEIEYRDRGQDFIVTINGEDFFFDHADYSSIEGANLGLRTFKFHVYSESANVIPFSPVSFNDWDKYYNLSDGLEYNGVGYITSRQRPYAGALQRRTDVQKLLKKHFSVQTGVIEQESYWREVPRILTSVFVPGYCNNMLDRGQFQYMAFGCATISPRLPERLPFNRTLDPGVHYVVCRDDYSDLIDIINGAMREKDYLIQIGRNAKKLFGETSEPAKLGEWIAQNLKR